MKRFIHVLAALVCALLVVPLTAAAAAANGTPGDLVAGFLALLQYDGAAGVLIAPIIPGVNLNGIAELFRPERIAQVIETTDDRGTPILDRFYPESRRRRWDQVLVPVETITQITKAVPLVLRGAPGVSITGPSAAYKWIEPQPIKTYDALSAVEFNNAALAGLQSMQQWADEKTRRHIAAHRLTTEALAAQSLSGTIAFPIASATGTIVDTMTVNFGTVGSYQVAADWTDAATTIYQVYLDLVEARRTRRQVGFNPNTVVAGKNILAALYAKIQAIANDTRVVARQEDDGGLRIGEFVVYGLDAEYYHPGGPGGTPTEGWTQVVGDDEVMMVDTGAPFTLLRVKLDNFKMPADPGPLGIITEVSKDGGVIELFAESKPFPVPVPQAIVRFDATDTGD